MNDLIERLRKRAEIRRQISSRKSVQEGRPDRIADLCEEAADVIEELKRDVTNCKASRDWLAKRLGRELKKKSRCVVIMGRIKPWIRTQQYKLECWWHGWDWKDPR